MDHSGTPERIDAHKLRRLVLSYRLKKTLQINDTADYWLIHWISPDDETPDDGSYVLLKYLDEDGKRSVPVPPPMNPAHSGTCSTTPWIW